MRLLARQIQQIARTTDMPETVLQRFLGSVQVELPPLASAASSPEEAPGLQRLDIGLRLNADTTHAAQHPDQVVAAVVKVLRDYEQTCPLIYAWMRRGDFNPKKFPERVDRARILHASRTVGRLRAWFFRAISPPKAVARSENDENKEKH